MLKFFRDHLLVIGIATLAAVFLLTGRVTPRAAMGAIDFRVLLVLFALLITVEILRASGYLDLIVERTVAQFHDTRPFAAVMILVSGALAALVTNDVTPSPTSTSRTASSSSSSPRTSWDA